MMGKYKIYIKTSPLGLKYLGVTKNDVYRYMGSGKIWLRHINKHKLKWNDIKTEIIFSTNNKKELSKMGIHFSKIYNIVDDSGWANLKNENGDGGSLPWSEKKKKEFGKNRIGRKNPFYGHNLNKSHMDMLKNRTGAKNPCATPVYKIDKNSKRILETFETVKQAAMSVNVTSGRIAAVCSQNKNNKDNTSAGYIWKYKI
jgi:hypothetical protein